MFKAFEAYRRIPNYDFSDLTTIVDAVRPWCLRLTGVGVEPHSALDARFRERKLLQNQRIMAGNDQIRRTGEHLQFSVALETGKYILHGRKRPSLFDVGIEMRHIGCEHEVTATREHTHGLDPIGVSANIM